MTRYRSVTKLALSLSRPQVSQSQRRWPTISSRHASGAPDTSLKKTPLYPLHVSNSATMVPFASFSMPLTYPSAPHLLSHSHTRVAASLFDVSHMVQQSFHGPGAAAFLERVTPAAISALPKGGSTLACLLWPDTGGIVDDIVIARLAGDKDGYYAVTNAACREKDGKYFDQQLELWHREGGAEVSREIWDDMALLALQGPKAVDVLREVCPDSQEKKIFDTLYFGNATDVIIPLREGKRPARATVTRAGYTGEDGFELSVPGDEAIAVAEALLRAGDSKVVKLAGLAARDSLRLEAGMCLYGHDLDDSTTPVEAGLGWTISKERRENGGFHGDTVIQKQLQSRKEGGGVDRKRVGLIVEGAPAREGAVVLGEGDEELGKVTSGGPSPTLGKNIAMAYLRTGKTKAGTEVDILVRGKKRKAVVTKMPFVEPKYHRAPR